MEKDGSAFLPNVWQGQNTFNINFTESNVPPVALVEACLLPEWRTADTYECAGESSW